MKRRGNLYTKLCSYEHLETAFYNASRNKRKRKEVKDFAADLEANLLKLQDELTHHTYRTSEYATFIKKEPKERLIFRLPFRDRVLQWAVMLLTEELWVNSFTRDTYACIKDRGIHACQRKLEKDLRRDPSGTAYCLKLDVAKFYPSIDHDILKQVIRKKIKDPEFLSLLDGIIDSTDGVPIGNYLSQYFANLYLAELDHLLKEQAGVKYYYRYADDLVILGDDKEQLRAWLIYINSYLHEHRNLRIKSNYQIFPVDARGIDFVGYVFFHTHTLLRKSIKKNFCRKVAQLNKRPDLSDADYKQQICSWIGWTKHCNSKNLINTIGMRKFSELQQAPAGNFTGDKLHIDEIVDKVIHLKGFEISESKYRGNLLTLQYDIYEQLRDQDKKPLTNEDGSPQMGWVEHITFTGSEKLIKQLRDVEIDEPVEAKIIKQPMERDKYFYKIVDPDNE